MRESTYWNGEPTTANKGTAVVADGPFPLYWARDLIGQRIAVVEVTYGSDTFYLDNRDGSGWAKLTTGYGSPNYGHREVDVERGSFLVDGVERLTGAVAS